MGSGMNESAHLRLRRAVAERQWSQKQLRSALAAHGYQCTGAHISRLMRRRYSPDWTPSDTLRFALEALLEIPFQSWDLP